MAFLKPQIAFCAFLVILHCSGAIPQNSYNQQQNQKVQLEDIEQDNLKSAQQNAAPQSPQATPPSSAQYSAYFAQNQQPLYFNLAPQQSSAPQVAAPLSPASAQPQAVAAPVGSAQPQPQPQAQPVAQPGQVPYFFNSPVGQPGYSPFAPVPAGQQQYYYLNQAAQNSAPAPQQSPVDLQSLQSLYSSNNFPYVFPQTQAAGVAAQSAAPNADLYKSYLASQTTGVSTTTKQAGGPVALRAAISPIHQSFYYPSASVPHYNYNFAGLSQNPHVQFVPYNSPYYPALQAAAAQKSVFSSGIKSTTPGALTKITDPVTSSPYRFEYNPEFSKLRVTG